MRHIHAVTRPARAFYYQLSLTQKIMELATLGSFVDSALGVVKDALNPES